MLPEIYKDHSKIDLEKTMETISVYWWCDETVNGGTINDETDEK
jgi:hypothetical protein